MDFETLNKAFRLCASFVVCKVWVGVSVGGRVCVKRMKEGSRNKIFFVLEKFHYFAQNPIWGVVAHTANRCCYNRHLKEGLSRDGALYHSWRPF